MTPYLRTFIEDIIWMASVNISRRQSFVINQVEDDFFYDRKRLTVFHRTKLSREDAAS